MADAPLDTYRRKRRFGETPEPKGRRSGRKGNLYAIQKHAARRLHYDLRLELDGVLKSWAVTRGPSLDPADKRLAVRTEDHPLDYAAFEGRIPAGNYGAGTVMLWDRGTWQPLGDPHEGLRTGKLAFRLDGERLKGRWALVRFSGREKSRRETWLLIKEKDDRVDTGTEITAEQTRSVASGRDMDQIAGAPDAVWTGGGERTAADAKLPRFVEPMLATLVDDVPDGGDWLYEVKFDGYRAVAAVDGPAVRIFSRAGLDWTDRYPSVAAALGRLGLDRALLDGEIVRIDRQGRSDFGALQQALRSGGRGLSFFVFDLLESGRKSLLGTPLVERKARLRDSLGEAGRNGPVYYTDHVEGGGAAMLGTLCEKGFEGLIAKRGDTPYRSGRGRAWLKVKCGRGQEFVVVGASPSDRGRPFASLLLGVHENGRLRYAGRVGSGFSQNDLAAIDARLRRLARKTPPVDDVPGALARAARWATPRLVVEIGFAEFTRDGLVRQARFHGLREDKPAAEIGRERAVPPRKDTDMNDDGDVRIAGVRLTNPDRVLWPGQGLTKRALAEYYDAAADRMLAHAKDRLVSLVRCPEGRAKQCFFQRHGGAGLPGAFRRFEVREKDGGEADYLVLSGRGALIAAAQMGVLELHIWGSRIDDVERPDRLVFDLDPDDSLSFRDVREAAFHMRAVLGALGLRSFPLVTGGKGVHVVAPLTRRHEWPVVKAFAGALAARMAADDPDRYVATMSKARRKGRIFVDYLRNERGATAIAPWSPRAKEGAPVACPVSWDELAGIDAANGFTLADALERLSAPDPWRDYATLRQSIRAPALEALGVGAPES